MNTCFGWLHLSDLHFLDKHAWRDNRVLAELVKDITVCRAKGLRIDLVFCTGDIGFGATSNEPLSTQYADASAFFDEVLKACELPRDHLFMVPGNHDIDRKKVLESQTEWFRSEKRVLAKINQEFNDADGEIERAMERLSAYRDFAKEYLPHLDLDKNARSGSTCTISSRNRPAGSGKAARTPRRCTGPSPASGW